MASLHLSVAASPDGAERDSTTGWLDQHAERLAAAIERPERFETAFDRSPVPMLIVDRERRYVDANPPARLAFRQTLAQLRRLRIDDLTHRSCLPDLAAAWRRLHAAGRASGAHQVASPPTTTMWVRYSALANLLPGLHLIAFVPEGWDQNELFPQAQESARMPTLTARELEIVELAAEGLSTSMIARELFLSESTVSTHFRNIYSKMKVRDRAAAVARAMRQGLIS